MRLFLRLSALAERRMQDGEGDARDVLARALDGAVEVALHLRVAVPWDLLGDVRRVEAVLRAGFRFGSERVRSGAEGELEAARPRHRGRSCRAARPWPPGIGNVASAGQVKRMAQASGAAYVALGRTGVQAMTESEYHALVESKSPGTFVVLVPEKVVLNFGKRLPLGQKRIMLPLLLELLRHPEQSFSMLELARRVWDAGELTPTVVTKVKVAVSRLRALLGQEPRLHQHHAQGRGRQSVVAYQVAPQLNFVVVEAARDWSRSDGLAPAALIRRFLRLALFAQASVQTPACAPGAVHGSLRAMRRSAHRRDPPAARRQVAPVDPSMRQKRVSPRRLAAPRRASVQTPGRPALGGRAWFAAPCGAPLTECPRPTSGRAPSIHRCVRRVSPRRLALFRASLRQTPGRPALGAARGSLRAPCGAPLTEGTTHGRRRSRCPSIHRCVRSASRPEGRRGGRPGRCRRRRRRR
ncbi:MAG: hypothetical protein U1F43_24250 [Myxococcota bacterium]